MQVSVSGVIGTAFLAALLLVPGGPAAAQIEHDYTQVKYDRGLNVQPAFEGWVRNPDGSIDLWFGYLNRNWAQRLHIPIGPDNTLDPGGLDHGQPTFFYARRHRYAFKVTVPEGWNDEYTWTLTVNGRTDTIHAGLYPEDELLEHNVLAARGQGFGIAPRNQPPSISIDATECATGVASAVTLTARVIDDGLPRPRTDRGRTRSTRPDVPERVIDPSQENPRERLVVEWIQWRGPGRAIFEGAEATFPTDAEGRLVGRYYALESRFDVQRPAAEYPVQEGTATTTVRFSEPGAYVLRGTARDGGLISRERLTVRVTVVE